MSKTIDERVVSMQFDNKQFESNVKTTMSTLDKLKQSLNLSGASKGLEEVNRAASKCNLSPLSSAVESVKVKFSAMEVMAVTALANITNSAVNAGKRIVESLTIAPVSMGFSEYELKMGAIQTIMASTGETLATVNEYLNELNKYSDQTIYSFQDMTQNIGKFTNAGVKLDDAVIAIKGIANEAALSGANANEASRAMYNFSQALSTGYIQRIDWKSIELANMATVEFKEQLLASAIAMGTVEKNAEGMWRAVGDDTWYNTSQMFIETLDEQWLTSEVLIETLKDYADETTDIGKRATAAATEVKTFTMLMDTLKESAQSGWATSWETIVGDYEEAKNLFTSLSKVIGGWLDKSADKRNNFLSEVLDSNWEKTIKQLNEAGISTDEFQESIRDVVKNSDKAQKSLSDQGKTLDDLIEEYGSLQKVFESGALSSDLLEDAIDDVTKGLGEFEITLDRVLKKGKKGDDVKQMQKILKELGYDLGEFGENLDGLDGSFGPVTQAAVKAFQEAKGLKVDGIVGPETLAALQQAADELNAANEETKGLVANMKQLVKNVDDLGGRQKLIKAITTLWEKLGDVFDAIKKGFENIFGDVDIAGTVVKIIDEFSAWVEQLTISEEVLGSIESIISGICAAIQTGAILGGGLFGVLNKIIQTVIRVVGLDLLTVLGNIGDALVKFRKFLISDNALADWFEKIGTALANAFEVIYGIVGDCADEIREWVDKFLELETVKNILETLCEQLGVFKTTISEWFGGLGPIFTAFFEALASLEEFSFENIWAECKTFWSNLVDHFGSLEGIFKPIIDGLKALGDAFLEYASLIEVFKDVIDWIKNVKQSYEEWINGFESAQDLPERVAESIAGGIGKVVGAIVKLFQFLGAKIVAALTGTSEEAVEGGEEVGNNLVSAVARGIWNGLKFVISVLAELGKIALNKLNEYLSEKQVSTIPTNLIDGFTNGIRDGIPAVLKSVIDLAKGVILAVLDIFDINSPSKVFFMIGGFIIAGLIAGLSNGSTSIIDAVKNIGTSIVETFSNFNLGTLFSAGIAAVMVFAIKKIADIFEKLASPMTSIKEILENFNGIASNTKKVLGSLSGALKSFGTSLKVKAITGGIKDIAIGIALLVAAVWLLTTVEDPSKINKAVGAIIALAIVLVMVSAAIEKAGASGLDTAGFASIVLAFGVIVLLIGRVIRKLGELTPEQFDQGMAGLAAITLVIVSLMAATNLLAKTTSGSKKGISAIDSNLKQVGGALIKVAIAMLILATAVKKLGKMDPTELAQGRDTLLVLAAIVVGLMAATNLLSKSSTPKGSKSVDKNLANIGGLILGIAAGMLLMAVALKMLGSMDWKTELLPGGIALIGIAGIIVGLMAATRLLTKTTTKWGGSIKESGHLDSNIKYIGGMILKIGAAILLMAVALKLLSMMEVDELIRGGTAMIVLAGIIVGLMAATRLITKSCTAKGTKSVDKNITQIGKTIFAIAGAMLFMSIAARILGSMDWNDWGKAVIGMTILGVIVSGLIAATKLACGGKNLKGVGTTLLAVGVVFLAMAACMAILSFLDIGGLAKGIVAVAAMSAMIAMLIRSTKGAKDAKGSLIGMAVVIGVMTACLILLSLVDTKKLIGATACLALMTFVFSLLIKATKYINTNKQTFGKTLTTLGVLAAVIAILTGCLILLAQTDPLNALGAATALSILLLALAGSMRILNKFSKTKPGPMLLTLAGVTAVVGALALIILMLRNVSFGSAIGTAIALSAFLYALVGAVTILNKVKGVSKNVLISLGALTLVVGGLAVILYCLRSLDPVQAIGVAVALSLFVLALSGVMAILGVIKGPSDDALASLAVLTLVVGGLAVILYCLRDLDPMQAIGVATALSMLLVAMSVCLLLLSVAGSNAINGVGAVALLTLVVAGLGLILYALQGLDPEQAIGVATALSTLLLALSTACLILGVVGAMGPAAFIGIGALATLIVGIGGLIAGIGALADKFPQLEEFLNTGIPILEKIGYALGSFFGNIVGGFLSGMTDGFVQIGSDLSAFMTNAQPFIDGAKNIDSTVVDGIRTLAEAFIILTGANILDSLTSWLTGGSSLADFGSQMADFGLYLKQFSDNVSGMDAAAVTAAADAAKALAEMANIIPNEGGMVAWFTGDNSLAAFGPQIASFGIHLKSFADHVAGIDPASVTAAAEAGKALAEMANIIPNEGGVAAWFAGENSLSAFGPQVSAFGIHMKAFADHVAGIDTAAVTAAAEAGKTIAEMANTVPNEGGVAGWFAGENSVSAFGANIASFGSYLKMFSDNTIGLDTEAVTAAADAGKVLAEMANTIPNEGGVAAWFAGENSLAAFGPQIASFGLYLKMFATNVAGIDPATVTAAAEAGKALASMADTIPNEGGIAAWFAGDNSLAAFSGNLPILGANLAAFVTNLGTFGEDQVTTVTCVGEAIKALALASESIDGQTEWAKALFGDNSLATFSGGLPTLGTNLAGFVTNLGTFTDAQVTTVRSAVSAINAIAALAESDLKTAKSNIDGFGEKLAEFGTDVASFCSNLGGETGVGTAVDNMKKIVSAAKAITDGCVKAVKNLGTSLKEFGKGGVKDFVSAFTSESAKTDVKNAAAKLAQKVSDGAKSKKDEVKDAFADLAKVGAAAIATWDRYSEFMEAGKYCVQGFADGITENTFMAEARAAAMALAALAAAKAALAINSPSKVFRDVVGKSVPEGFAAGIDKFAYMVTDSTTSMAANALDGTRRAISKLADVVNTDIDTQPTIRPVLDLSDVASGASTIGSMFSMTPSVGVLSNVGSISSMMNQNQNGVNDDVIAAIKELGDSLSGSRGDTYQVGDITYDDGSNIADAIKTLVGAARRERRV